MLLTQRHEYNVHSSLLKSQSVGPTSGLVRNYKISINLSPGSPDIIYTPHSLERQLIALPKTKSLDSNRRHQRPINARRTKLWDNSIPPTPSPLHRIIQISSSNHVMSAPPPLGNAPKMDCGKCQKRPCKCGTCIPSSTPRQGPGPGQEVNLPIRTRPTQPPQPPRR